MRFNGIRVIASFAALFLASGALFAVGYSFNPVIPCRLVDTRGTNSPIAHGEIRHFTIVNLCGIPADAKAAALNFIVASPTAGGHLVAFPYNVANPNAVPLATAVNWNPGETAIANGMSLQITNAASNISVQAVVPGGNTHLIIDVTGFFR